MCDAIYPWGIRESVINTMDIKEMCDAILIMELSALVYKGKV